MFDIEIRNVEFILCKAKDLITCHAIELQLCDRFLSIIITLWRVYFRPRQITLAKFDNFGY